MLNVVYIFIVGKRVKENADIQITIDDDTELKFYYYVHFRVENFKMHFMQIWWPNGYGIGLVIQGSWVRVPLWGKKVSFCNVQFSLLPTRFSLYIQMKSTMTYT